MPEMISAEMEMEIAEDIEVLRQIYERYPETARFMADVLDAAEVTDEQ